MTHSEDAVAGTVPDPAAGASPPPPPADRFADALRGFGPIGIAAMVVILIAGTAGPMPVGALLALAWAHRTRTPWPDMGFVRPASWPATALLGVACGVAFKLVMKALVMPLLGADPINHAYHYLAGNRAALPAAAWTMVVNAGFGEETVFRGYAFERLGRLLGHGARARVATVLLTSLWFGLVHYPNQGLPGVEQAAIVGLAFGTFLALSRSIVPVMFAHAAFDLTAVAIIYANLETRVAHLVFH